MTGGYSRCPFRKGSLNAGQFSLSFGVLPSSNSNIDPVLRPRVQAGREARSSGNIESCKTPLSEEL
jgi:hypothetical protein